MRKLFAAVFLAGLVGHAAAQTSTDSQNRAAPAYVPCAGAAADSRSQDENGKDENRKDGEVITPCGAAAASGAATGNLAPLYVGASVVATAVIAGAIGGGGNGHNDHTPASGGGTGGTGGTTGTTGTH